MNLDQAYKILDYGAIPLNRTEQIKLIQIMSYTWLKGGDVLSECRDRQLRRVAQRLFKEAESKVHAELNEIRREEEINHYHAFLCDLFNLSEAERENYTISQLEEELQQ